MISKAFYAAAGLGALICATLAMGASAATVFSEDFSGATPGFGYTGAIGGTKFSASRDIDIVGVKNGNFYDCGALNPGGNCLDLVGGTGAGGSITSTSFALTAGTLYTLNFADAGLAGNTYSATIDGFTQTFASIGSVLNNSFSFTPLASTSAVNLTFTSIISPDTSHGPTLANITLSSVGVTAAIPEPASWSMMIVGFGAIGAGMRHRRHSSPSRYA